MSPSINLVVLRCTDLERSRRFYEALGLGLTPEQHGRGPRHYSSTLGALVLELYPASDTATTAGLRLGLVVPNLVRALENIRAISPDSIIQDGKSEGKLALIRDPDGHKIQLEEG